MKQPDYGYMKDGCTPVRYYVKEMPLPPPFESKPGHLSHYEIRCMEIDVAALLLRNPDAFAAVAAEPAMARWDAGICWEPPSKQFLERGGCPFYREEYLSGDSTNVLCDVVGPQIHGYVGLKFCEEGRKAYCPIWRAKGVQQDMFRSDVSPDGSGDCR